MDTQTLVAVAIVFLAAVWGGWMLLSPFVAALRPPKEKSCGGGCGCGHENGKDAKSGHGAVTK